LYHHFPSKEALLGEMLVAISEHLLAQSTEIAGSDSPPADRLAALVDAHVEFAVTRPELITVQFRDLVHAPPDDQRTVRRLQRRYVETWVDVILEAVPDLDGRSVRTTVHALFGLLNSTPHTPTAGAAHDAALLRRLTWRLVDPATLPTLLDA
jgi:AcrR family transcriptional regulator